MNQPPASIEGYPWTHGFDDLEVTFRPMSAADRDAVLDFARALPERDLLFLRNDITQGSVVDLWLRDIDAGRTVTLLAESGAQLIGHCSLHNSESLWTRHLGDIILMVHGDYRGRGLGGHLARQILELAKGFDHLQKLVVQMMSTLRNAQSLFHHLGFIPEAMLHDWVIDGNGRTHNLIMMSREVDPDEDFFSEQTEVGVEVAGSMTWTP
ncbi:MAG: GNAT family N-acetyltransferase [Acidobacteriota bacterium]